MDHSQKVTMSWTVEGVSTKPSVPNTGFSNYKAIMLEINSKMTAFQSPYIQLSQGVSWLVKIVERDLVNGFSHESKEKGLNNISYGLKQAPSHY